MIKFTELLREGNTKYSVEFKATPKSRVWKKTALGMYSSNPGAENAMVKAITKQAKALKKQEGWHSYRVTIDDKAITEAVDTSKWGIPHGISDYLNAEERFVDHITKNGKAYFKKHFNNLKWEDFEVKRGRRWNKVVRDNGVYCFIDRSTGDIYKPAGYKAPAKGVRASIFDPDSYKGADHLGSWLYRR